MLKNHSKPTQKDVADRAGFAVTTVSRALAGDPLIAASTRTKIAQVADEIGYVPDRAAQRLRTGRTNVIALVLDPHGEILDFSGSMISGFAEVVRGTRYHLNLTQYQLGEDPMAPIRNIVRNRLADGIVFARTEPQDARVRYLLDAGFPFVTHGRTDIGGHAWYDYDNAAFAEMAVEKLVSNGRKRILIVPPSKRYTFARHMTDGFKSAIGRASVQGIVPGNFDLNAPATVIHEKLRDILSADDRPDGFITAGEIAAMAGLAAIEDAGLTLGVDIDLIAKQTSRVFDLHRPRVETVFENIENAGRTMAQALLDEIEGNSSPLRQTLQRPEGGAA